MAGSLAFQGAYAVSENQSTLTITVNRSGSTAGAASVTVISLDGTATAGSDFTAVSQILTWGAGDALNKTFTVAIKDDAVVVWQKHMGVYESGSKDSKSKRESKTPR